MARCLGKKGSDQCRLDAGHKGRKHFYGPPFDDDRPNPPADVSGYFSLAKYGVVVRAPSGWTDEMAIDALATLEIKVAIHLANLANVIKQTLPDVTVEEMKDQ